jgi:hypothetical protein
MQAVAVFIPVPVEYRPAPHCTQAEAVEATAVME